MVERWKIIGKNGVELVQCSFEEGRISVRTSPASGFMTRLAEPAEAVVSMPNKEIAEALALILRNTTIEEFKHAKVIRAD